VQVRFASVASGSADLAEFQRAAEQAAGLFVESLRSFEHLAFEHQVLSPACGQAVLRGVMNGFLRAGFLAIAAEQAAAEVEPQFVVVDADRVCRTSLGAGSAAIRALGLVDDRQSAKAIGQRRLLGRIRNRPMALVHSGENDVDHGTAFLECGVSAPLWMRRSRFLLPTQVARESPKVASPIHSGADTPAPKFTNQRRSTT